MTEKPKPLQQFLQRFGLRPKRQNEVPEKHETEVEKNMLETTIPDKINSIKYADLSQEDQLVFSTFLRRAPRGSIVMIERETGKLEYVSGHVKAQVDSYRMHGDKYPTHESLKDIARRYVEITFPEKGS
jgi:hypothetical protein